MIEHRICFFKVLRTIVRGVNVGVGHGSSVGAAKRKASVQALEYLRSHGTDLDPILLQQMLGWLTLKFSAAGHVTSAEEHSSGARRNTNQLRFVLSRWTRAGPIYRPVHTFLYGTSIYMFHCALGPRSSNGCTACNVTNKAYISSTP